MEDDTFEDVTDIDGDEIIKYVDDSLCDDDLVWDLFLKLKNYNEENNTGLMIKLSLFNLVEFIRSTKSSDE